MTTYELASCVVVVKNMLATGTITTAQAVYTLWDLVIEASPLRDVIYKPGTSVVIDTLLNRDIQTPTRQANNPKDNT